MKTQLNAAIRITRAETEWVSQAIEGRGNKTFVSMLPTLSNVTGLVIEILPEIYDKESKEASPDITPEWASWFGDEDFQSSDPRLIYARSEAGSQPNGCNDGNQTWFEFIAPMCQFRLRVTYTAVDVGPHLVLKIIEKD